ncbi:hypothetical protein [Nitrosomonas sp.]|nr:hypothetical protein [Nitrosomonas sp.]
MSRSFATFTGILLSDLPLAGADRGNLWRLFKNSAGVHSHDRGTAL